MQTALEVITDVHADWARAFGRNWAPLVEEYRLEDADIALVTIGSMSGAAKDAVDAARAAGIAVGVIRIKTFRPFPAAALARAAGKVRALGVVDRAVSYGWNCGPVCQEVRGALYGNPHPVPVLSFIGGLAGADLTEAHFARVIADTAAALTAPQVAPAVWLNAREEGTPR